MATSYNSLVGGDPGFLGYSQPDPSTLGANMGMPQQNQQNFFQTLGADMGNMQPAAPAAAQAPDPSSYAPPASPADPQNYLQPQQFSDESAPGGNMPRKRLSLVDTIGRLSDVFAKVGGAPEQYQPYLDQRVATAQTQQGNSLDNQAKQADIRQTGVATQTAQNSILGNYARAVQGAIKGGADPHQAMAGFAEQMGVPANVAAVFGHQYDQNPATLDAMAAAGDPNAKEIYGTTPLWFTGPDGKPALGQISSKGNFKAVDTGGLTPSDEVKTQNLGDRMVYTTKHGSAPVRSQIINGKVGTDENALVDGQGNRVAVQALPGSLTAANEANAATRTANDTTRTGIAANKAAGANPAKTQDQEAALRHLDAVMSGFDKLHQLGALPGEGNPIIGAISRSAVGQYAGGQAGTPAAQTRAAMSKDLNNLQMALVRSLPASATRSVTEQKIMSAALPDPTKMSYATAKQVIDGMRQDFMAGLAAGNKPAPLPSGRPVLPAPAAAARNAGKPQVIGW